ncbi:MAG: hypothetical protein ABTD50_14930 [Polyangiaceae bacterium]|jgi:hypothetical protein
MDLRTVASTERDGTRDPGVGLPSIRVTLAIEPISQSPSGDLHYGWHVLSARVLDDPDAAPFVVDGLRREVGAIAYLAGEATIDNRGLAKDVTVRGDAEVDPSDTPQMVEQIRQTLRDLAAPFPDDEIGVGARWRKVSEIDARSVRLQQNETLTLVEARANQGIVEDEFRQTARGPDPNDRVSDGAAPSMLATGHSRTRFDLERIVPQTTFDGTTRVTTGGSQDGLPERVTMILRVSVAIEGALR